MKQIKKGKYIINIERVDGIIYIQATGIVPKDIKNIIEELNKNTWMSEEVTRKTLLKEIECR
jgi:hypothetical protein